MSFRSELVLHARVVAGQGGGPDKTILNSPRFLEPLGYRSECLYLRHPEDDGFDVIRGRAEGKKAPLIEVDDFGVTDFGIVKRLRDVVAERTGQTVIWHGHDYKTNLLGLMLRKRIPELRLVTTAHGWVHRTWKTPAYYAIDRWAMKRYEYVICVSRDLHDVCEKLLPPERLSLIDNAIALDDYEMELSQADAREQLELGHCGFVVSAVGRLSAEKGFDVLINAVAGLISEGHDVGLAIAGDGVERESLGQQIKELRLQGRIRLLGFVKDPRVVYRASDVYALSSYREGLPNVVLEAMAMRVPVVSTRIAGMPDLVEDDVNGLMVEPGDQAGLQSALARVLGDKLLRSRLGEAGRATVEERFNFQTRMEKIAAIYDRVLGQGQKG